MSRMLMEKMVSDDFKHYAYYAADHGAYDEKGNPKQLKSKTWNAIQRANTLNGFDQWQEQEKLLNKYGPIIDSSTNKQVRKLKDLLSQVNAYSKDQTDIIKRKPLLGFIKRKDKIKPNKEKQERYRNAYNDAINKIVQMSDEELFKAGK